LGFDPRRTQWLVIGGTAGYNWQAGSVVYGLEADYNFSDVKGSIACGAISTCQSENTWFATFRGRIGYAPNNWMFYITGGLAIGGVKNSLTSFSVKSESTTRVGWTFGGGIEYLVNPNWTVGVEALYVDLGDSSTFVSAVGGKTTKFSNNATILRFKANYKW
jgi:outer membrane immunogenic protein